MQKLIVRNFSISLDGFGAGVNQDLNNPIGIGGHGLHQWFFPTDAFQQMFHKQGEKGLDNDFATRDAENVGAYIMGRNMFGPVRGNWPDDNWQGWWGENPPFHSPVFVLTNHARESIIKEGGTTFHFVTDGIEAALERARASSNGMNVQVSGGVSTIQQYLKAGLIDEMHIAISPIFLGAGERLFENIDLVKLGYQCVQHTGTEKAVHILVTKA